MKKIIPEIEEDDFTKEKRKENKNTCKEIIDDIVQKAYIYGEFLVFSQ